MIFELTETNKEHIKVQEFNFAPFSTPPAFRHASGNLYPTGEDVKALHILIFSRGIFLDIFFPLAHATPFPYRFMFI